VTTESRVKVTNFPWAETT